MASGEGGPHDPQRAPGQPIAVDGEPKATATARSPRSTWQADRKLTVIRIISGLVVGYIGAAVTGRWQSLGDGRIQITFPQGHGTPFELTVVSCADGVLTIAK
ncbi:hypothetical protein [Nonomuraea sp. NPDC049028]|uniref:hypothetical protein n=1 Tax=Nonomuraea sp. NPDC049028 TaxID=3364348 RepID=UPI003724C1D9